MESSASLESSNSGIPRQNILPSSSAPESRPLQVAPSIVSAEPQGELFPLLSFANNFKQLVQEQKDNDRYHEYFADLDKKKEAARRCNIKEDLEQVNQLFTDPTVFGLLKEWHDGKLADLNEAESTLRPAWSSVFGQVEDITEYGDSTNLHLQDLPRFPTVNDFKLNKLLSSSTRGRRRIPFGGDRSASPQRKRQRKRLENLTSSTTAYGHEKCRREPLTEPEEGDNDQEYNQPGIDSNMTLSLPNPSINPITELESVPDSDPTSVIIHSSQRNSQIRTSDDDAEELSNSTNVKKSNLGSGLEIATQEKHDQEDASLIQEIAEERAVAESRFVKTAIENNFQKLSLMIDDCKLMTLSEGSRFTLPMSLRLPMNYLVPQRVPSVNHPQPISKSEIIVSVALYSPHRHSERTAEYLCLGSQPLTAIRDAFYCLLDFTTKGADELPLDAPTRNRFDKKVSNSFFFIEGIFYTDSPLVRAKIDKRNELRDNEQRRLRGDVDNSRKRQKKESRKRKEICDGKMVASSAQTPAGIDPIQQDELEDMQADKDDTTDQMRSTYQEQSIEEIELENEEEYARVSLDYSQIYNEKHDERNRYCYPKPIFKAKSVRHMCRMCNTSQAFYVTVDDRLAGETPCYFCKQCYDEFHYDEDGNILYDDFRVFEYSTLEEHELGP
ncbi:small nuclear RNA activating complex, polypeptide 3 [Entomortierella lignicola]|nr:small nuclear RNA activating complex, polypeptide 3 [Entomortierella lignicola]